MSSRLHAEIRPAVEILGGGGVVAVPTDTLYGLAADATNDAAVARVFRIKGRAPRKGFPLLLADPEDLARYADSVPEVAWSLIGAFMPGALTLVLRKGPDVSDLVTGGLATVAFRVPDHPVPRAIVRELGSPITGTSANRAGGPDPATAAQVAAELDDILDLVVDLGPAPQGTASTIVDVSTGAPRIVREGGVSRHAIEEVCGEVAMSAAPTRHRTRE